MMTRVAVALGERSYDIHIGAGALNQSGSKIAEVAGKGVKRLPVVTDANVAALHYPALAASLEEAGFTPLPIVLLPGEQTKSFVYLEKVLDGLLALEIERGGLIVAFGGGVIGDLTGFAAGILKRGVAFAQIPTTLLSQVDSSVGGKTAIDTRYGKNLVGVFHQPKIVIADTDVLKTLPKREILSGYAEVVKYGLLGDADFFAWLETNAAKAIGGDETAIDRAVAHSCRMKAGIVARDERETGDRALLNLGHTFAHALETELGYSDALTHGEAVAMGCVLAFRLSAALGHCTEEDATRVETHLKGIGFRTRISQISGKTFDPDALLAHMRQDKKAEGRKLTFILARGIGQAFVAKGVAEDAVRRVLAQS